ncbi:MAG: hypothetical protein E6733_09950 [Streptococcus parasanguinis]|uniref:hypothetical protein n=1 Tax=Leclercia adecarboxylata TaxID=83655 RepID=UPI000980B512|nr:hypothetical protein [Leclercia adecarboxylata]MDU1985418.1 hypothetical protein [Streptococcus parasanguinis]OOB84411.1 hypothetical protein BZY71_24940 [Leclercia adecarboxylata]
MITQQKLSSLIAKRKYAIAAVVLHGALLSYVFRDCLSGSGNGVFLLLPAATFLMVLTVLLANSWTAAVRDKDEDSYLTAGTTAGLLMCIYAFITKGLDHAVNNEFFIREQSPDLSVLIYGFGAVAAFLLFQVIKPTKV